MHCTGGQSQPPPMGKFHQMAVTMIMLGMKRRENMKREEELDRKSGLERRQYNKALFGMVE